MREVEDININGGISLSDLARDLENGGGFEAKNFGIATDILTEVFKQKDCLTFISFPACVIATGLRGIVKDLLRMKLVDAVITTCGTLDHDIARSVDNYYHGSFDSDDIELQKQEIHRLGNIFIPQKNYGLNIEQKVQPVLTEIYENKHEYSTFELIYEFGKRMDEDSIMFWSYKNEIPIFVPGITDGAFGSQLWIFKQAHRDFKIDLFGDEDKLAEFVFNAKKTAGLCIGGGISKHHLIWWNQFREGLDYCIYITTATEYDGSLSGARAREAVSWNKIKPDANYVTVRGDATIILPFLVGATLDRMDR